MFEELLSRTDGCIEMVEPFLEATSTNIRKAMLAKETFGAGLQALDVLLQATGNLLLPQLGKIVPMLARHAKDPTHKDGVLGVLRRMEAQCGPEATKVIKSKIPTY